jgi:hypothetical protein
VYLKDRSVHNHSSALQIGDRARNAFPQGGKLLSTVLLLDHLNHKGSSCRLSLPLSAAVFVCCTWCMVGASLLYTVDVAAHQGDNIEAARLRLQAAGATGCGLSTITHGSGGRAKLTQLWLDNRLLHKEDLLKYLRELAASSTPSTCLHLLQQLVQEGVCSWEVLQVIPHCTANTHSCAFQQAPESLHMCAGRISRS